MRGCGVEGRQEGGGQFEARGGEGGPADHIPAVWPWPLAHQREEAVEGEGGGSIGLEGRGGEEVEGPGQAGEGGQAMVVEDPVRLGGGGERRRWR